MGITHFTEIDTNKLTTRTMSIDKIDMQTVNLDTSYTETPTSNGTIFWDSANKTMAVRLSEDVVLQIGQEQFILAINKTDSVITNGSVVFVSGAQGNKAKIELADANSYINSKRVIGVATQDIAVNQEGYITTSGVVRGLDTSALSEGDCLYLSETAGQLTTTPPSNGVIRLIVAMVLKSHVTDGWIGVRLHDDKYMFGDVDNGNYSYFESDGTLVFNGNATIWRDEMGALIGQKLESPSSHIEQNNAEASVTFKTNCTTSDYIMMSVQLNHDWKPNTDIHLHLHWWQTSASVPNWLAQYRWQKQGQAKTTEWTNIKLAEHEFTYTSGTLNQISEFEIITTPENYHSVSDIIQIRLLRDISNTSTIFAGTDPLNASVDAVSLDIHKVCDTLGSRSEYSK